MGQKRTTLTMENASIDVEIEVNPEDGLLLRDILLHGKPLKDCELVFKCKNDNTRLYVIREPDHHSFYAHAVEFHSSSVLDEEAIPWDHETMEVKTLFTVTAYFDGVRHLEFNRNGNNMDGYLYYPPMAELILMLQKIREIELEICWDADRGKK